MFHDLNVTVGASSRAAAVETCARLGYDVIALTTPLRGLRKLNGAEHGAPRAPAAASPPGAGDVRPLLRARGRREMTVLSRATVYIDDAAQLQVLSSSVLKTYDVVAVAPANEKLLGQVLQFDVDVVALDFGRKPAFYIKRPQLHVAEEKVRGAGCG